jgi:hypothetical protein
MALEEIGVFPRNRQQNRQRAVFLLRDRNRTFNSETRYQSGFHDFSAPNRRLFEPVHRGFDVGIRFNCLINFCLKLLAVHKLLNNRHGLNSTRSRKVRGLFIKLTRVVLLTGYSAGTEWCSCMNHHSPSIFLKPMVRRNSSSMRCPFPS